MNGRSVRILFLHEAKMLLRDRRTIFLAFFLPLITVPLILYAMRAMETRRKRGLEELTYRYAVVGSAAETLRALIDQQRRAGPPRPLRKNPHDSREPEFRFHEVPASDPEQALRSREIHFYISALNGTEADALQPKDARDDSEEPGRASTEKKPDTGVLKAPSRPPGLPLARIFYLADRDDSRSGRTKMREFLAGAVRTQRNRLLRESGLPLDPAAVFAVEETSTASVAQATGSQIGKFLTPFLIMFILSGGSIVALDIIAGEKERGSLETLLTTAASRAEIVAAKQLAILSVALCILFIQVGNILVYINFKIIELPEDWIIEVTPLAAVTLVLLFLPVSVFLSAVLLMISAYAKSYKEAQLYFFPVYLVSMVPAVASVLPGISLRSAIALVPIANVSVAAREVLVGKFDWLMLLLTFAVTSWSALAMMRASTRMLSLERLITTSDLDIADLSGGPALFSRQVLAWYAVMGALLLVAALNLPQVQTFRGQLLFNELAVFLGCALLMIWKYRLNIRDALALRPVNPLVWPAVLLLIPSGALVGVGVFRLANLVFPVPESVLEQFSQEIFPAGIPWWQMVFFIAVLPGICEEIAFRGTLLYGLHRRFRPVALTLMVGIIFGLFHVALFRIIPTAYVGVVLTALALLTGSIFPGMLLHAGNNAWAFYLSGSQIAVSKLHWSWYLAAAAVFAAGFYLIYRVRTPYPGLRTGRRSGNK